MDTINLFKEHGQGHVFAYWDELGESERSALLEQAEEIDLAEIGYLVDTLVKGDGQGEAIDFDALAPAPVTTLPKTPQESPQWQEAKKAGEQALRSNKVAAFTVAGGQGTRLGYDGPKGTFPVTPVKNKTLFQVFAEKILAVRRAYACQLPWYIMTSHANHEATESFFQENAYFGLEADSVRFFRQGRLPAVDLQGKIILESKSSIAMSPDGHGGSLRALERSGSLGEMRQMGIEALSYFQVDNPLVQCIDPYFIGFHFLTGSTMSSKALPKAYEKEKIGHFCVLDNKLLVVEYSDMPDELVEQRDAGGELRFSFGSIAIHILSIDFVAKLLAADSGVTLPFHKALKKVKALDSDGKTTMLSEPNGIKFEMFVFDALPFAENPLILETTRLGDFSPVKNAEGVDSPKTSRDDQMRLFASWLADQGIELALDDEGVPINAVEIAPSFGYSQESFSESWSRNAPDIPRDGAIYLA